MHGLGTIWTAGYALVAFVSRHVQTTDATASLHFCTEVRTLCDVA
jgi:hypothetical protein